MTYRWLYAVAPTNSDIPAHIVTKVRRLLNREVQPALLTVLLNNDLPNDVLQLFNSNPQVRDLILSNASSYAQTYLAVSGYDIDNFTIVPTLVQSNLPS